jgi:hypothetical protein
MNFPKRIEHAVNTDSPVPTRKKTQAEQKMEVLLENMEPDSLRFQMLHAARKFKSNWLDLGAMLSEILRAEDFKDWGFEHFDGYCKQELMIKPDTVMKLIASFRYLEKYKPEMTRTPEKFSVVPDFKAVDKLIQAEENPALGIQDSDLKTLRHALLEEGLNPAGFKKRLQAMSSGGSIAAPRDNEELTLEKAKRALENVKKMIAVFQPDRSVLSALQTIEEFIDGI